MILKNPAVSVCVPAYNTAPFLRQCIESALSQTFEDIELVLVDNASTDGTFDIAQEYERRDSRVRAYRNPRNIGLHGSYDRCMDLAKGAWVKFLCADDWLESDFIRRMLAAERPGVLVMNCVENYVFEPGIPDSEQKLHLKYWAEHSCLLSRRFPGTDFISAEQFAAFMAEDPTLNGISTNSAMIHRSAFDRFGRFNRDLLTLDDWEFFARTAVHTGIVNLPEALTNYRIHATSYGATTHAKTPFKMDVLSPLLIRYQIAYAPVYSPVRKAAMKTRINLQYELFESAREARVAANRYSSRGNPDVHALDDWKNTLAKYPRILSTPRYYRIIKAWRRGTRILHRGAGRFALLT